MTRAEKAAEHVGGSHAAGGSFGARPLRDAPRPHLVLACPPVRPAPYMPTINGRIRPLQTRPQPLCAQGSRHRAAQRSPAQPWTQPSAAAHHVRDTRDVSGQRQAPGARAPSAPAHPSPCQARARAGCARACYVSAGFQKAQVDGRFCPQRAAARSYGRMRTAVL